MNYIFYDLVICVWIEVYFILVSFTYHSHILLAGEFNEKAIWRSNNRLDHVCNRHHHGHGQGDGSCLRIDNCIAFG